MVTLDAVLSHPTLSLYAGPQSARVPVREAHAAGKLWWSVRKPSVFVRRGEREVLFWGRSLAEAIDTLRQNPSRAEIHAHHAGWGSDGTLIYSSWYQPFGELP